jgi:hypothetical protein
MSVSFRHPSIVPGQLMNNILLTALRLHNKGYFCTLQEYVTVMCSVVSVSRDIGVDTEMTGTADPHKIHCTKQAICRRPLQTLTPT